MPLNLNPSRSKSHTQNESEVDDSVNDSVNEDELPPKTKRPRIKSPKENTTAALSSGAGPSASPGTSAAPRRVSCDRDLPSTFKRIQSYKTGGDAARKITHDILFMICKDMEPFQIVERQGFKKLMKTLAPQYTLPDRKTLKKYMEEKYEVLAILLKKKLEGKSVTLTTDIWTDVQMRSYLSLTVHYFDDASNKMISNSLGVFPLEERHTADKAIEKSPGISRIITKVKEIVAWFKRSVVACDELRKKTEKKVIQHVSTRWNSVYMMIERFVELRPHINEIMSNHTSAPEMITASELISLSESIDLLQPLMSATETISGEKYGTSSLVIPIVSILQSKISESDPTKEDTKVLKQMLQEQLVRRFDFIERVRYLGLATLLDPRFKKMYFHDQAACSRHIIRLNDLMRIEMTESVDDNSPERSSSSDSDHPTKKRKGIFSDHNKKIQHRFLKEGETSRKDKLLNELSLYLNAPVDKIQENPFLYWINMRDTYPVVSRFALQYLPTVATSVPSERLFSRAGKTITPTRNRLSGKLASKLIFLSSIDEDLWNL
ncbi:hypothetical protein GE061_018515 [Apolygus lucorum]|uniref:HAT C-terminal dimerisation domain-containing protein n=1 Tax=Apolygus lucorum TaxID=248454 RepID=A0A8S9XFG8_APOLU|nr:hypothetical protein GE061_018515 [Apolygus lucorum]